MKNIIKLSMVAILAGTTLYGASTKTEISEIYVAVLNRASDGDGNKYWQTDQSNMAETTNVILTHPDVKEYLGESLDTNQAFVEQMYKNILDMDASDDPEGVTNLVKELDSGDKSKGEIVISLINLVSSYKDATDTKHKNAYNHFINRVEVSNYMADNVAEAPSDYAVFTNFDLGLKVTDDMSTVNNAKDLVRNLADKDSKDTVPPVITINGESSITIVEGSSYSDKGATAKDNIDGEVVVKVVSNVDTSKVGTYTVVYTAKDKAGNKAATLTRTVIVKAKEITDKNLVSIKGDKNRSMQVGETIDLEAEITYKNMDIVKIAWFDNEILLEGETNSTLKYEAKTAEIHSLKIEVKEDDNNSIIGSDTVNITVTEVENKAPTVDAGEDKTVKVNESITITGTATDSDGDIVSYEWKKGDEVLGTEATLNYTSTEAGVDTLILTVTDNDGAMASDSVIITVESIAHTR